MLRSVIGRTYPFVRFLTLILIPTMYWISVVELGCALQSREEFSLSFGQVSPTPHFQFLTKGSRRCHQVLAMFVALPPLLTTMKLLPRLGEWVRGLAWVCFVRGCLRMHPLRSERNSSTFVYTASSSDMMSKEDASLPSLTGEQVSAVNP